MDTIFDDLISACKYFNSEMTNNEAIETNLTIKNSTWNFNIYKLTGNIIFSSQQQVDNIFKLCKSNDCATQVLIFSGNVTIDNKEIIFTPPYRCKGLVIYCVGTFTNSGTVSMTSRGCIANGLDVYLYKNEFVPARGAAGGDSQSVSGRGEYKHGNNGKDGVNRQTGGGGTGGIRNWWYTATCGRGGYGTSFSGGSGSGSACSDGSNGWAASSSNASDNGGSGSNGVINASNASGYSLAGAGGNGNPIGNYDSYRQGVSGNKCNVIGNGGLLIMYASNIINNGSIQSNGGDTVVPISNADCLGAGGGSGAGSVNIFYCKEFVRGNIIANKGIYTPGYTLNGGVGGNGCVTIQEIPIQEILNFSFISFVDCYPKEIKDFEPGDTIYVIVENVNDYTKYNFKKPIGVICNQKNISINKIDNKNFVFNIPNDWDVCNKIIITGLLEDTRKNANIYKDSNAYTYIDFEGILNMIY